MVKTLIIYNPFSGNFIDKVIQQVEREFIKKGLPFKIVKTERAGHAREITQSEFKHFDVFLTVGGDGTVNEVAQVLIGTSKILAIFPVGSGNGLAKSLSCSKKLSRLVEAVADKKHKKIDVLDLGGRGYCLNIFGLGLDGDIAHRFALSSTRGFRTYLKLFIKCYRARQLETFRFAIRGNSIQRKGLMLCVANSRQFGNEIKIAPKAKLDDGLADVILVKEIPFLFLPLLFFRLLLGIGKMKSSLLEEYVTDSIEILESTTDLGHIDGEPHLFNPPCPISIKKHALSILDS